jgi:hypothetical protein
MNDFDLVTIKSNNPRPLSQLKMCVMHDEYISNPFGPKSLYLEEMEKTNSAITFLDRKW